MEYTQSSRRAHQQAHRRAIGRSGEDVAADFLRRRGYVIRARNQHSRYGEIDIVAAKNGTMHYVEVKTRTSNSFGMPEEAVNRKKLTRIKKTIQCITETAAQRHQIDLIAIEFDRNGHTARLTFYKNLNHV